MNLTLEHVNVRTEIIRYKLFDMYIHTCIVLFQPNGIAILRYRTIVPLFCHSHSHVYFTWSLLFVLTGSQPYVFWTTYSPVCILTQYIRFMKSQMFRRYLLFIVILFVYAYIFFSDPNIVNAILLNSMQFFIVYTISLIIRLHIQLECL